MLKPFKPALIFFLAMFLQACSTQKIHFVRTTVSDQESVVYIYRPDSMSNIVVSPDVYVDNEKRFALKNSSYNTLHLQPGEHRFRLDLDSRFDGIKEVLVKMQAGKEYFLRVSTQMKFKKNDLYYRRFDIEIASAELALNEIKHCRYLGVRKQPVLVQSPAIETQAVETAVEPAQQDEDASFSISKSRDPFSHNR